MFWYNRWLEEAGSVYVCVCVTGGGGDKGRDLTLNGSSDCLTPLAGHDK